MTADLTSRERLERCLVDIDAVRDNPTVGPTAYMALSSARDWLERALLYVLDEGELADWPLPVRVSPAAFEELCRGGEM